MMREYCFLFGDGIANDGQPVAFVQIKPAG